MRAAFTKIGIAVFFAAASCVGQANAADPIRIAGTGTVTELLRQVGAEFTAAEGGLIEVVPNLGSGGALRALADGKLDIAVSARALTPDEIAVGLRQVTTLRTAYVLATSRPAPPPLQTAELPAIYTLGRATWRDGVPVRIILRPRSESDNALLTAFDPRMAEAIEAARRRGDVPVAATDQDNADLAQSIKGSIIGTTLTQLITEKRSLWPVTLDGVEPTLANFESGRYRFNKPLYFILPPRDREDALQFIGFLRSTQGKQSLRIKGVLPGDER